MDRQVRTVTTADGIALTVEIREQADLAAHVPTVVFAHDWGLTRASWEPVLQRLAPAGVRMVTWDQRGHGMSSLGLDQAILDALTVEHLGRDLGTLLRTFVSPTSPVILVGHSLGGMTAMAYLAQHPVEARSRVAGAVLASTAAVNVRLGQSSPSRLARLLKRSAAGTETPPTRDVAALFGEAPKTEVVESARDAAAAVDPAVVRAAYRAFCQADVRAAFPLLSRLPVSILAGAADQVTPPTRSRAMTITLNRARFATVPGAGHLLPYEAPDRIAAEVRWVLAVLRDLLRARAARRQARPAPALAEADD